MFARHLGVILERDAATSAIWGRQGYFVSRSMDVYVSRLRKYLAGDPRVEIRNIHGRGFKLVVR
jgi:DNA-binding response OmpR family regulator